MHVKHLANRTIFAAAIFLTGEGRAAVTLPPIFSDHMVLQKSARTPVWGKADPGEKITVSLADRTAAAVAGTDGQWTAALDLHDVGAGPFTLTLGGKPAREIKDVLVGQVWLASGQSNMEFTLAKTIGGTEEVANSANPQLRQYFVTSNSSPDPQEATLGRWTVAGPGTAGSYSAVAYYFGKTLQHALNEPVGLLNASWGGSALEAWMDAASMDKDPALKETKDRMLKDITTYPQRMQEYETAFAAWARKYGRETPAPTKTEDWAGEKIDETEWEKIALPATFAKARLPDAGVVWVRKTITLPPLTGEAPVLELGQIGQFDEIYCNGRKVAETTVATGGCNDPRAHRVPPNFLKEGENVIAIRVEAPLGQGGFLSERSPFRLGTVALAGKWLAKVESEMPAASDEARRDFPTPPPRLEAANWRATCLYNGMIHPMIPYGIAGVIWYQGETNIPRAAQYATAFPLLIEGWRKSWPGVPFFFCQLPNCRAKTPKPGESQWAELREAQTKAATLPDTAEAVLIDLGEAEDIHPRNKKDVGERLARIALAKTYGRDEAWAGPVYQSSRAEGNAIRVAFTNVGGGLEARKLPAEYVASSLKNKNLPQALPRPGSELQGFAICGKDRAWVWADARIDGATVVVSAPEVPEPVAVRYAWADNPTANLYNQAGLPAGPFRTDDFPLTTRNARY